MVLDQHLIDIFEDMTRPMVIPSCPQELAAAYMGMVLAERLSLAGRNAVANAFVEIFNAAQKDFRDVTALSRGAWQQGDMLVRGQWLFTTAHELVHALLHHANFLDQLDDELGRVQSQVLIELGNWVPAANDSLKREPILRFFAYAHGDRTQEPRQTASALTEMASVRLSEPRFRQEVICDWLAARATAAEMLHWTPYPIGLATCGLALIHLATIKQLDSYAAESAAASTDHLGEGALRLAILRTLLYLRPPDPESSGHLISRAFGDVTSAYLETYAMALRITWRSAIDEIVEALARR
ncbi:hypothetical protein GCM10023168_05440 [Fodinibacter luteus]|uniref:Uncharacterized protein n=1 Tax=Fodinibacter luteus TaxID=552064 RepID=A0ABP8K0L5_9MICO